MKKAVLLAFFCFFCLPPAASAWCVSGVYGISLSSASWELGWSIPPASTPMIVLSTHTDFSITISSGAGSIGQSTTEYLNLTPNTTHYFEVKSSTEPDPAYQKVSTMTHAAVPALAVDAVYESIVTLSWDAKGNPGYTPYELSCSTDNFATNFSTPVPFSADLTDPTTDAINLSAGTTYYFRVRARNGDGIDTGFSEVASTPTCPAPLDGLSGYAMGLSSITWNWNNSGGLATRYKVYSASSGLVLSDTSGLDFTLTGISTNTAQGIKVQPYTASGQGLSSSATYYTWAAVPSDPGVVAVCQSSVTISWSTNTNPSGTNYIVQKTTDEINISTVIPFSANLTDNTTTVYDLDPGTTYFLYVMAQNGDEKPPIHDLGYVSVSTPTHPSLLEGLAGESPDTTSIEWSWNSSGGAATKYRIFSSTGGNPLYTTGDLHYTRSNLSTNTAYGIQVRPFTSSWTQSLSGAVTVYTWAAVPKDLTVDAVYQSSVTISWSTNTNPSGTHYIVHKTTDDIAIDTPIPYSAGLTEKTTTICNLQPGTTYIFYVKAQNEDEKPLIWSLGYDRASTNTYPAPLAGLSGYALGLSSMTWTWDSSGGLATRYRVYSASSGLVLSDTSEVEFTLTGVATNTAQGIQVQPFTNSWSMPLSDPVTTYTLAAPPKAVAPFPNVYVASISVQWESNGNPPETPYEVSYSTDNFITHFSTPVYFDDNLTDTTTDLYNLAINTSYYIRLRARNHLSTPTAFTCLNPVYTLAKAPGDIVIDWVKSDAASITWNTNGNPGYTPYEISYSTDNFEANFSTPVYFSDNLTANSTDFSLEPGTTYWFRVRAQNRDDVPTDFGVSAPTQTLPAQVTGLSGYAMGTSSITWNWTPVGGANYYNLYQATSPTTLIVSTDSPPVAFTGLSTNTGYGLRVAAVDLTGQGDLSVSCTVYTLAVAPANTWANPVSSTVIEVSWDDNGNPPGTEYEVSYSSVDAFATGWAISTAPLTTDTTQTLSSLEVLTTYYTRVRAFNGDNPKRATSFDDIVSARTLPSPDVLPNPFSLLRPINGNFQPPLETQFAWEENGSPGPPIDYTLYISTCSDFSCGTSTSGISGGDFTVSSSSLMGGSTHYGKVYWKVAAVNVVDPYIRRYTSSFWYIVSSSQVNSADGSAYVEVISGQPEDTYLTIEEFDALGKPLLAEANKLAARERRFHILRDKAYLIAVKNNSGQSVPVSACKAKLSFSYSDTGGTGFYEGTPVKVDHIQIARLNENTGQWETVPEKAALDRQNRKVTGFTNKLSYFTLLGSVVPLSVLSGARNCPNPFYAGRETTEIQYTLTEDAEVTLSIYTPFGDLVWKREFGPGAEGGRGQPTGYTNKIPWDGRSGAGKVVANGIYACRIVAKTDSGEKKIVRLIGVKK